MEAPSAPQSTAGSTGLGPGLCLVFCCSTESSRRGAERALPGRAFAAAECFSLPAEPEEKSALKPKGLVVGFCVHIAGSCIPGD